MSALRAILILGILTVSAGGAVVADVSNVADACSCSDCDVVVDAPAIVGGRVGSWYESEIPAPGFFTTIVARIEVDQVFKGSTSDTVRVVDIASLSKSPSGWFGASGGCGSFDEDPTGKYIILGLEPYPDDEALVRSNRLWLLYIGDEPKGEWYERALARLAPLGPPSPPNAGNTIAPTHTPATALGWALITCSIGLAASAIARRR